MNTPYRFAIWAAVSTKQQAAADKISIPDQIEQCRDLAGSRGWIEAAGPFVAPGQSRTLYVNLRDAERDIPDLRAMLDAAQHREFEILLLYHLNRFRDLLDPVFRTLGGYRVQLYSITQPLEPVPPDRYNYQTSETINIIIGMTQLTARAENANIRRRYESGMPARVRSGLPANLPPFGYFKPPGRKTVPVQQPALVAYIHEMKDRLLAGESLRQIAIHMNDVGVSPPKGREWYPQTIKLILTNPFYAGKVRWGATRVERDFRTASRFRNRSILESDILTAPGKHEPLWDDATLNTIRAHLKRRSINYRGRHNNQFTGLLRCSVCGSSLWRQGNGPRGPERIIWRCSQTGPSTDGHVNIPHVHAIDLIGKKLAEELGKLPLNDPLTIKSPISDNVAQIADLQIQRQRLLDLYQLGQLDIPTFSQRDSALKEQIRLLEDTKHQEEARLQRKREWLATAKDLAGLAQYIPHWFERRDPNLVNHHLRALLDYIMISPEPSWNITLHYQAE